MLGQEPASHCMFLLQLSSRTEQECGHEMRNFSAFPSFATPLPLFTLSRQISGAALDPVPSRLQRSRQGSAAVGQAAGANSGGGWLLLPPAGF